MFSEPGRGRCRVHLLGRCGADRMVQAIQESVDHPLMPGAFGRSFRTAAPHIHSGLSVLVQPNGDGDLVQLPARKGEADRLDDSLSIVVPDERPSSNFTVGKRTGSPPDRVERDRVRTSPQPGVFGPWVCSGADGLGAGLGVARGSLAQSPGSSGPSANRTLTRARTVRSPGSIGVGAASALIARPAMSIGRGDGRSAPPRTSRAGPNS